MPAAPEELFARAAASLTLPVASPQYICIRLQQGCWYCNKHWTENSGLLLKVAYPGPQGDCPNNREDIRRSQRCADAVACSHH